MLFEVSKYYTGEKIRLKPRVELYDTRDYMGKQMPGLAIVLDEVDQNENVTEQYAVIANTLLKSLLLKGKGVKSCAHVYTVIFLRLYKKRSQNSCIFFAPCGIIITHDKMRYGGQDHAYQNYA